MRNRAKIVAAKSLLIDELSKRPSSLNRLRNLAEKQGISQTLLYKAAKMLDVIKKSKGFGGNRTSVWSMGTDEANRILSLDSFLARHYTKLIWLTDQALANAPTDRDVYDLEQLRLVLSKRKKAV